MRRGVYGRWWGAACALNHAGLCLALGAMLTEALLWGFDGMPCSRPWRPEHANVRKWWPAYLFAFALLTTSLPAYERSVTDAPSGIAWLAATLVAISLALRISHRRRHVFPDEDFDEPGAVQVLNLH